MVSGTKANLVWRALCVGFHVRSGIGKEKGYKDFDIDKERCLPLSGVKRCVAVDGGREEKETRGR